ncbi:undecaprenyl/decaprenyl-phosphate alpha-N-acetylglucosaminyl 1-phosphate transferase [Sulfurimonas sp. SAG-AH-194-L11]|nr:MraY family glycosyltransferase [Sulfurimonas sp. SAG-AH-194-L11]MDF1877965.1 undecaprenyl/decaprenyl-phosphate alpha-N-acetylglucosaminyl 1-phosphate transferase [Sulfurimonas sp. SAG-AH-194-L11]
MLFIKLILKYAHKLNLYDVPNECSHHCSVTPSGAGIGFVSALFFAFIGFEYHSDIIVLLSTFTIASLVIFLFFNWYPAKIFMGDSGSLTLGFIISVLAVLSLEYVHPIALVYLMALPLLDTLIVMFRRIKNNKSPFSPDKTHIHHILVKFFDMNVPKTVAFLVVMQLVFSAIGYMILDSINKNGGANLPLFVLLGFVFMFILFYMIFTGINTRQSLIDNA